MPHTYLCQEFAHAEISKWAAEQHENLDGKYPGGGIQLLEGALKTPVSLMGYCRRRRTKPYMTTAEAAKAKAAAAAAAAADKEAKAAKAAAARVAAADKAAADKAASDKAAAARAEQQRRAAARNTGAAIRWASFAASFDDDSSSEEVVEEVRAPTRKRPKAPTAAEQRPRPTQKPLQQPRPPQDIRPPAVALDPPLN
eukprot:6205332-Pleurochrysis_carterae.AAC.1